MHNRIVATLRTRGAGEMRGNKTTEKKAISAAPWGGWAEVHLAQTRFQCHDVLTG